MKTLACFVLLLQRTNCDRKAILTDLARQTPLRAFKMALAGAMTALSASASMAATITVHPPDSDGRVFVDVVGKIDNGDFEAFKEKTDQIRVGDPKRLVIVTLVSYGGSIFPAMQIGEWVRKRGMLTFVPGERTCASACALIWAAGSLRTVGDAPQIGFHAAYDEETGRESGAGNAIMGAYLSGLGFGYKAIYFMTHKGPTSVEWLTPDLAMEKEVAWFKLQPPRATSVPPQRPGGPHPPPEVFAAWSKLMPRPVTTSPDSAKIADLSPSEAVNLRFPTHWTEAAAIEAAPRKIVLVSADTGMVLFRPSPTYPVAAPPVAAAKSPAEGTSGQPKPATQTAAKIITKPSHRFQHRRGTAEEQDNADVRKSSILVGRR
jgi:hypothetical protein